MNAMTETKSNIKTSVIDSFMDRYDFSMRHLAAGEDTVDESEDKKKKDDENKN